MYARKAFTLIELLVVISIITLLLAVLLPALGRSRAQAKSVTCLNNLRGIALAVQLYAHDHNERFPGVGLAHGGSGSNEQGTWVNTLRKHYDNDLIARCPADASEHWETPLPPDNALRRVSYAANYYMAGSVGKRGPYDRLRLIKKPSTTIHLGELTESGEFAVADHVHPETWFSNPAVLAAKELAFERHLGRANYSFFDGHSESLAFDKTYAINKQETKFPKIVWTHNLWDPEVAK